MTQEKKELLKKMMYKGMVADIAEELEISPSFVSRVINGRETSQRVWDAIESKIDSIWQKYYVQAA